MCAPSRIRTYDTGFRNATVRGLSGPARRQAVRPGNPLTAFNTHSRRRFVSRMVSRGGPSGPTQNRHGDASRVGVTMPVATAPNRSADVVEPRALPWPWREAADPVDSPPLRLLMSSSVGSEALDGAWWPYGQDLRTEAIALADHFPSTLGRIVRLLYSAQDWTSGPGRVRAARAFVTLASFPNDDTKRVLLRTDGDRRVIQLLVVPRTGTTAQRATRCGSPPTPPTASRQPRSSPDLTTSRALAWPIGTTTEDIPRLAKPGAGRHHVPGR